MTSNRFMKLDSFLSISKSCFWLEANSFVVGLQQLQRIQELESVSTANSWFVTINFTKAISFTQLQEARTNFVSTFLFAMYQYISLANTLDTCDLVTNSFKCLRDRTTLWFFVMNINTNTFSFRSSNFYI